MSTQDDLHRLISQLNLADQQEAHHFLVALLRRTGVGEPRQPMDGESRAWLDAAADDMTSGIATTEASVPPAELKDWYDATAAAVKPARYIPGRGLVVGEGA